MARCLAVNFSLFWYKQMQPLTQTLVTDILCVRNKNCVIRLLLPGYGSTFLFSPSDAATTSYFCGCRESNCAVITSPVPWGPTVKQQLSLLHPMNLIWVTGLLHFDPTVVILWNSIRGTSLCFRREDQEHDLVET